MNRSSIAGLSLVLFLILVANSSAFFFARPYYEYWDLAANSLAIDRAKHFHEMYGSYSRWGFHHPGPVLFYVQALGEWIFYDILHWAAAPFNGQVLAHLALMVFFFAAAVVTFARWLPARVQSGFVCAAVALGALHFAYPARIPSWDVLRGSSAFSSTWSAHAVVLPLLCLLAAGASVAAGRGADLPLVAVAGGVLVHAHIAQPLFVVPLTLLACGGLLAAHGWRPVAVWRAHRRPLLIAGGIVALFVLPIALDLLQGADSNLAAVLRHIRVRHQEHRTWLHSLLYFLQFGAYSPYAPGEMDFHRFDEAGVLAYFQAHAMLYAAWAAVAVLVLLAFVRETRTWAARRRQALSNPQTAPEGGPFLAWAGIFLLASFVLTLYWGVIQDGLMYYYNAWSNFGIYYFALLIAAAELCVRLDLRVPRAATGQPAAGARFPRLLPPICACAVCLALAAAYRIGDPIPEADQGMHESIARAMAAAADPRDLKVLNFPRDAWPMATSAALQLERAGESFTVSTPWALTFEERHGWKFVSSTKARTAENWQFSFGPAHRAWSTDPAELAGYQRNILQALAEARAAGKEATGPFPLLNAVSLDLAVPTLLLTGADSSAEIRFTPDGNAPAYLLGGWSGPDPNGTWTEDKLAVLRFRAQPVGAGGGVELTLDAGPFVSSPGPAAQRLQVLFDGEPIGPQLRLTQQASIKLVIPAALWNRAATAAVGAALAFDLPDAISPAACDPTGRNLDSRTLGLYCERLRFRARL